MVDPNAGAQNGTDKYSIGFSIEGEASVLTQQCDIDDMLETVVARLVAAHGRPEFRELMVSVEDADEPTALSTKLNEVLRGNRRGRAHLHRCRRIKLTVEYNGKSITDEFPPAATVHRVLKWAVGPKGFNIQDDVHDLALQVAGTTKALEPSVHIGTLVRPGTCMLALELVSKDRPQG